MHRPGDGVVAPGATPPTPRRIPRIPGAPRGRRGRGRDRAGRRRCWCRHAGPYRARSPGATSVAGVRGCGPYVPRVAPRESTVAGFLRSAYPSSHPVATRIRRLTVSAERSRGNRRRPSPGSLWWLLPMACRRGGRAPDTLFGADHAARPWQPCRPHHRAGVCASMWKSRRAGDARHTSCRAVARGVSSVCVPLLLESAGLPWLVGALRPADLAPLVDLPRHLIVMVGVSVSDALERV
jgi:hypothetical protein